MCDATKGGQVTKLKQIVITAMQLSLTYKVFRWHSLNIKLYIDSYSYSYLVSILSYVANS